MGGGLRREQLLALMVAELDGKRRGVGDVRVVEWPDEARRDREAVELLGAYADGREVVVEHTRIESFDDQTRDRAALGAVFVRDGPALERDGAACYTLGVEPGAFASITYIEPALVRDVITDWVRDNPDRVPGPTRSRPLDGAPWPAPGGAVPVDSTSRRRRFDRAVRAARQHRARQLRYATRPRRPPASEDAPRGSTPSCQSYLRPPNRVATRSSSSRNATGS